MSAKPDKCQTWIEILTEYRCSRDSALCEISSKFANGLNSTDLLFILKLPKISIWKAQGVPQ